jgi:hypothetical protein
MPSRPDSAPADTDPADDVLLRAIQVRRRYGEASDMWLFRRLRDDPTFPRPIFIGPARYWRLSSLLAWEHAQAERPAPQPRIVEYLDAAHEALAEKRAEEKRKRKQAV